MTSGDDTGDCYIGPRYNVDNPEHLRLVTETGLIWHTPYAQRAIDAIRAGAIDLARCKNVPPQIAAALRREGY